MKNLKYFILGIICVAIFSCKKDNYMTYRDVARLQFGPELIWMYTSIYRMNDTLKQQTFFYYDDKVKVDTVYFDLYTSGNLGNQDRAFKLEQENVPGTYNAVPGLHYRAFSDPVLSSKYVMKAGARHMRVPIVLLRDQSLKTNNATLKFSVVANENFQPGEADLIKRKLIFTDRLSRPNAWDESLTTYTYGKYSVVKHKFMIDVTGQKWDQDFMVALVADVPQEQYWVVMIKTALIEYNKAHPTAPLRDEFNELVILP